MGCAWPTVYTISHIGLLRKFELNAKLSFFGNGTLVETTKTKSDLLSARLRFVSTSVIRFSLS